MYAFANDEVEYDQTKSYSAQADGWSEQTAAFIRLSQVYLWYAEAVGRSGQGDKVKAIELLNTVRRRADGKWDDPSYNFYSSGMSNDELAEAAYNEHGWEIAGYYWGNIATRARLTPDEPFKRAFRISFAESGNRSDRTMAERKPR